MSQEKSVRMYWGGKQVDPESIVRVTCTHYISPKASPFQLEPNSTFHGKYKENPSHGEVMSDKEIKIESLKLVIGKQEVLLSIEEAREPICFGLLPWVVAAECKTPSRNINLGGLMAS